MEVEHHLAPLLERDRLLAPVGEDERHSGDLLEVVEQQVLQGQRVEALGSIEHDLGGHKGNVRVELPDPSDKGYAKMKAKLESGKDSMTKLDTARVEYLHRHGFDAQLLNTNKFPKGDVIIVRRKK